MSDPRSVFVQGAMCGACSAVGLMLVLLWQMLTSSPQAGVLIAGQFRPYRDEPVGLLLAGGGALLLLIGLCAAAWAYRRIGR